MKKPALTDVVFRVYLLSFDDEYLKKWTAKLMKSCCKKLLQQPMTSTTNSFTYMGYLTIVHEILKRDRFKSAWLQSPYFFGDLERLYSLHLPTFEEWKTHLKVVYHPLLNKNN